MASTKRERSAFSMSEDVSARLMKKARHIDSSQHSSMRHAPRAADVAAKHRFDGFRYENNKGKGTKPHPPINKQRPAHRAMSSTEKRAKQQHLDDQVGFIILTRDNNKPDAYSAVSTTYGPQSWLTVAKAYNEKYGVSVTPAAMEKRARQHRAAWVAKHPTYPSKITYAKRNDVLQTFGAGTSTGKSEERETLRAFENDISHERSAGWTPPDEIRNSCDIRNYIERATLAGTGAVTIEIFDRNEALLGEAAVDRQILQEHSGVLGLLDNNDTKVHVQLYGPLEKIVQYYVLCTSSRALPKSPGDETYTDVSLMQLYCLAAQLDDDHVRGLVMDRWRLLSVQNKDVEFVLDDLNLLFECTRCSDPARNVWARSVCAAGLAGRLLAMDGCGSALADCLEHMETERRISYMEDEEHWG